MKDSIMLKTLIIKEIQRSIFSLRFIYHRYHSNTINLDKIVQEEKNIDIANLVNYSVEGLKRIE